MEKCDFCLTKWSSSNLERLKCRQRNMKNWEAYFSCTECLVYDLLKLPTKKYIKWRSDTNFYYKSALVKVKTRMTLRIF